MKKKKPKQSWSWQPHPSPEVQATLQAELESWEGTPYFAGQQCKGAGVDCVRFVCAVMDKLTGQKTLPKTLPQDAALHVKKGAIGAMRKILELYGEDAVRVKGNVLLPGDVIVSGPKGGGPGHALIVGGRRNEVWHASGSMVHRTGIGLLPLIPVFAVYRKRGL